MKIRRTAEKILFITAAAALTLLFTSCPESITAPMVALVEDEILPTINISSPQGGDNYYSTVTVEGIIADSVLEENDNAGQIVSVYYEIANDDLRKGKIDIGLDDSVSQDTEFGDGEITYDVVTGEFSFSFSTIDPNILRDLISLSITAVDRNNNEIKEQVNLFESDGPGLDFYFYDDATYSEESRISTLDGYRVYVGGTVSNSDYDNIIADEIYSISWGVIGSSIGGDLDLSEDSENWDAAQEIYWTSNNIDETKTFSYDPSTREFKTSTDINVEEESQYFYVEVFDKYGHSTRIEKLLTKPAALMLFRNSTDTFYYSPDPDSIHTTILLPFSITDPNDALTEEQITTVKCSFSSTKIGETAPTEENLYTYNGSNFDSFFNRVSDTKAEFNAAILLDDEFDYLTGYIYAKVTVTDNEAFSVETSYTLSIDEDPPDIDQVTFEREGIASDYISQDDTLALEFRAVDSKSGMEKKDISEIKIELLQDEPSDVPYSYTFDQAEIDQSNDFFSVELPLTSRTSDADGQDASFSITLTDRAGNVDTYTAAVSEELTFYGPYDDNICQYEDSDDADSIFEFSTNNSVNPGWARATSTAHDTLELTFISNRELDGDPYVTIAERPAAVNGDSAPIYTATFTTGNEESLTEGSVIPFTVELTDMAGNDGYFSHLNGSTYENGFTYLFYDNQAPLAPDTPVYTSSESSPYDADDFINAAEAGSVSMDVYYGTSGAGSGDTIKLYLEDSPEDILIGSEDYDSSDSFVSIADNGDILLSESDGDKYFYALVVDQAGNVGSESASLMRTLDRDTPEITITGNGAFGAGAYETVALGIDTSDTDIDTYHWSVAGTGTDPNTSSASFDPATPVTDGSTFTLNSCSIDGQYTTELYVIDEAGNQSSTDSFDFIWDDTPFTQEVSGFPEEPFAGVPLNLSTSVNGAECGISGYSWTVSPSAPGAFSSTSSDTTTFALATNGDDDGEYTVTLTTTDNLGRADENSSTFTWETSAPNFTSSVPGSGDIGSINSAYSYTASADDDGSGLKHYTWTIYNEGGSVKQNYASNTTGALNISFDTAGSSDDGNYTAVCVAEDVAGNTTLDYEDIGSGTNGDDILYFDFTWDNTEPQLSGSVSYSTTGAENSGDDYYYEPNDSITLSFDLTDLTGVDDSAVSVTVFATDGTGYINETFTGAEINKTGNTYSVTHDFSSDTSDDDGTTLSYSIYTADTLASPNAKTIADSVELTDVIFYGTYSSSCHSISVASTNDNSSYAAAGDTVTLTITSDRKLAGSGATAFICDVAVTGTDLSVADNVLTAKYDLVGDEIGFTEGDAVTYSVNFDDAAGNNFSASDVATSITWDCTDPPDPTGVSWAEAGDSYINKTERDDTSIDVTVTYDNTKVYDTDDIILILRHATHTNVTLGTFDASGDGSDTLTFDGSSLLGSVVDDTAYELRARILDPAGNYGSNTSSSTFEIDTAITTPSISGATAFDDEFTLTATGEDSGVSYSWSIPGATVTNGDQETVTASFAATGEDSSSYTADLEVTDAAGNYADAATHTFAWDAEPLTVSFSGVSTDEHVNSELSLDGTVTGCESGVDTWAWSVSPSDHTSFGSASAEDTTFSATQDEPYTITYTVTDNLSNEATDSVSFTWDANPPSITPIANLGDVAGDPVNQTVSAADTIGVTSYSWAIEPTTGITATGYSTDTINITAYDIGITYTVTCTVGDAAGNTADEDFTFSSTVDRAVTFTETLSRGSGGSSTSGLTSLSSGGVSRIYSTSGTSGAGTTTSETTDSNSNSLLYSGGITAVSEAYSGGTYSLPVRTTAAPAAAVSSSASAAAESTEEAVSSAANKIAVAGQTSAELQPEAVNLSAGAATSVKTARTVQNTAGVDQTTSSAQPEEKIPQAVPIAIIMLLAGTGAVIIFRRRRT